MYSVNKKKIKKINEHQMEVESFIKHLAISRGLVLASWENFYNADA